ncbi:MAG: MFS transporter [Bacilli bacterium]
MLDKSFYTKLLLYILLFANFFDMFSQFPVMSPYVAFIGGPALLLGIVVGTYSFANMFGNLVVGQWLGKAGTNLKWTITGALFLTGSFLFLYSVTDSLYLLFVIRLLHGFMSGFIVPSIYTYLSTMTESNNQGKEFARSGGFIGLAAIIGPAFGGIMQSKYSVDIVFSSVSILLISLGICSALLLKSKKIEVSENDAQRNVYPTLLSNRRLRPSLIGGFSLLLTLGILTYSLPLKVIALGYDAKLSGMLMSTFGIVAVLVFILPINRIFDRYSPILLMSMGQVLITLVLFFIHFTSNITVLYVAMGIFGLGYALIFPSSNKWIMMSTNEVERGAAFSLYYACFSIGVVAGSFFASLFTESFGAYSVAIIVLVSSVFYSYVTIGRTDANIKNII